MSWLVCRATKSYEELRQLTPHLGENLVVQTAFGDSGHTTFFISCEADWNKHADEISADPEVLAEVFSQDARNKACDMTYRFGEELRKLGSYLTFRTSRKHFPRICFGGGTLRYFCGSGAACGRR